MKVSICCLIYKSLPWLEFVYRQLQAYTDLAGREFFFVANDATPEVLASLRQRAIPHYIHHNSAAQQSEWFINNVYRAYNFGAAKAQGDFLVFINSDMAFSPNWLTHLTQAYNGSNCLTSRLVESGRLASGQYGIERDFGTNYSNYREADFLAFCQRTAAPQVREGGLYMPLLIHREAFLKVGGYPEGNVRQGSDLFAPVVAQPGEPCVTGDLALMRKLSSLGIIHQTVFNSLVYHFQRGESDF
jgi:glycosyltransferase involved in cell wall biosynthesis